MTLPLLEYDAPDGEVRKFFLLGIYGTRALIADARDRHVGFLPVSRLEEGDFRLSRTTETTLIEPRIKTGAC